MVKINFECMIAGETSFILSKHKEEMIKDVIDRSLEITGYSYEMC